MGAFIRKDIALLRGCVKIIDALSTRDRRLRHVYSLRESCFHRSTVRVGVSVHTQRNNIWEIANISWVSINITFLLINLNSFIQHSFFRENLRPQGNIYRIYTFSY